MAAALLAATSLSVAAFANEEPRYAAPAAWVAVPDAPLPQVGASARDNLLIQSQEMRLTPGKRDTFFDYAIRVSSAEQLEQVGTIRLSWQPDRADIVIHRIAIIREGTAIDLTAAGQKLTVLRREQELERSSIDGTLTATLAVKDLRVGDVLRYSATFEEVEETLGGATEGTAMLKTLPDRVAAGNVRVIWPSDLPLQWRSHGQKLAPVASESGGWRELSVKLPVAEQAKMPADAPLRFRMAPELDMSSFADWQAVSRTAAKLYGTDGVIKDGGALAKRIDQIAQATTDPRRRTALALQMVQDDIRYLYTGLENGNFVPQKPEESWALRYGDCKAKTLLLLATLRRLGIEADAALVDTKSGDTLAARLPAFGAFDHIVVRAMVGGTDLWLDGTTSGAHIDDLGDVPPFAHALPVTAAGSPLIALPARAPARPLIDMGVTVDQSAGISLPALVTVEMRFRGPMGAGIYAARDKIDDKRKRDMAARMSKEFVENVTPLDVDIEQDAASGIVIVRTRGIGDLAWDRSSGRARLEIDETLGDAEVKADRGRTAWRDLPLEIEASHLALNKSHILPGGAAAFTLDGDANFTGPIGIAQLTRSARFQDMTVAITDRVTSDGAELPAATLGQARDQLAKAKAKRLILSARPDHPAPWQEVVAARDRGLIAPLETAFAKGIALQPDEAQPLLDRAYFYRQIYAHQQAVDDFTAALALDRTADTLVYRGYSHDSLRNADAALDDMRAALELDPSNESARDGEIYLLQHAGNYAAALERAEDALANAGEDRADRLVTRGQILSESGDFAAGLADLDEANRLVPGNSDHLNGRCWLRATANKELDRALADCTRAIELSDNAASSLDSRGMVHFRTGRFADALADYDAALKLSPSLAGSLFMRSLTHAKLGNADQAARDLAGAKLQWPGVVDEFARHGIKL